MITVGIDEVGRGCWAGPLVAAAVVLDKPIPNLNDSKKLSKIARKKLAKIIYQQAKSIGLGWVPAERIDQIGLSAANREAMEVALVQIQCEYDEVIIDGSYNFLSHHPKTSAVVKADGTIESVSAASIVAKVARDAHMILLAGTYPGYGFEAHVGYGTKLHSAAIKVLGVTPEHRKSYKPIQKILLEHE